MIGLMSSKKNISLITFSA